MIEVPAIGILGFGYLGRPLAERAYQAGAEVAAVKRRLSSDDINLPIVLDGVDAGDDQALNRVLAQHWQHKKVWICLLPPSAINDYEACLKNWCDQAKAYGAKHLIYSSSVSVYGNRARLCDENSPLAPESESARRVEEAERIFLDSGIANVDILRLGGLYDSSRHPLTSLLRRGAPIENGDAPVNMLHRERAVAALWQAVQRPAGIRIRNLVERVEPSRRAFYTAEAVKLGLPLPEFEAGGSGKTVTSLYRDL